jgi:NAD(P)-dependent dehydrogenase (short-subunit alcohol dehydrogenase family)
MFDVEDTVVIITGASSGIGYELAIFFADCGAQVFAGARRQDRLAQLEREHASICGIPLDITDTKSIDQFFNVISQHHVEPQVLINNAGITTAGGPFPAELRQSLEVNMVGTSAMTAEFVKRTIVGNVINVASILGVRQQSGTYSYSVSKAALIQATKLMALDLAPHYRVNALAPGYINTEDIVSMFESYGKAGQDFIHSIPLKRFGDVAELFGPILFLASEASSYVTGTVLTVDGGHMLKSL